MGPPNQDRKWLDWLLALSFALASAGVVLWQNSRLAVLWDLSYVLENSYRITLGDVPYRDFPFPYPPLTFLAQAALIKTTGRVFFHHVIYCAVIGGFSTLLTWRILLKILRMLPQSRLLALVLIAPLTVLNVYAIFPHPFYDPDCTFAVLVCLLLLEYWFSNASNNAEWDRHSRGGREAGSPIKAQALNTQSEPVPKRRLTSPILGFVAGAALVIPVFVKQNTGLAFLVSAVLLLTLLLGIDLRRGRFSGKYVWLLAGLLFGFGSALFLIQMTAGFGNYIQWTVRFAAERRTPRLEDMIGVYRDPHLKWWLTLFLISTLALWLGRGRRILVGLSMIVMATPFVWPAIYLLLDSDSSERAERLIGLWPFILIVSVGSMLLTIRRHSAIELILPLIVIATVHGAFLSQQLWGSTYALWPLFMILVAKVITALIDLTAELPDVPEKLSIKHSSAQHQLPQGPERRLTLACFWPIVFAFLISLSLLISGFVYLRSHERLDYANLDDGELSHSKLPPLKGLSMRGSWIPDFEELVEYTEKQIPRDDGILCLPGEDLFYYTTARRPRFVVLMFDHTVNPYSPREIVDLARERNIQWLIVKDELQLEEEPLEKKDELMSELLQDFESVESLNNYEIYKRKSTNSEEDTNPQDHDDDAESPSPEIR